MSGFLIIEDEPAIQELLKRMIGNMGHAIALAGDGDTGYRLAQADQYDVILSDLHMPGNPSGMDLIRLLRDVQPTAAIIIVSGHPSSAALMECKKLGITDFLTKPFEVSFVRGVVQDILKRKAQPSLPAT